MTHEVISIEAKNASTVHVLTGTINSVRIDQTTADVILDEYGFIADIPIFYHCEETEERKIANKESGKERSPFLWRDRVIIVHYGDIENLVATNMKIVGFEDGLLRECTFYIDITINGFIPAYIKTLKLIDNNGVIHIKQSTSKEPSKVGPFRDVAFPTKAYLYMDGNAPHIENDTSMLFSYFTADPIKEFTVVVETWKEGSTIKINNIVLGNGEQQKFRWDFVSKTWLPVLGGVDDSTTLFMARIANPESGGYNQACKKEVVNAYEGTRILLTHGDGNPQTMGEIYDYCFSAKKVHSTFHGCDTYRPYYGLVENLPEYGPPYESVVEDLYYLDAWRVAYLLMDDDTIKNKPENPINFTASRLGRVLVKDTHSPGPPECNCDWSVVEQFWNVDNIKYKKFVNEYLIVAVMGGAMEYDTPHNCNGRSWGAWYCGYVGCDAFFYTEIGDIDLPAMGIMTDSDGHNAVFGQASLSINYIGQQSFCQLFDEDWETIYTICETAISLNSGARRHEFKEILTPEHKI